MDYRLQAVRDSAIASVNYCNDQVATLRAQTQGSREANHRVEAQIARKQGEAAIYQWCVDQLGSFSIPAAGQGGDTGPANAGHGTGRAAGNSCGTCAAELRTIRNAYDTMMREGRGYGWDDSDCVTARDRLGVALTNLAGYFDQH